MSSQLPTQSELAILSILWSQGPSTVRQVHTVMGKKQDVGYTTVLKFMQNMHGKGLLKRDISERAHVYEPAIPIEDIQSMLVKKMLDGPFLGSAKDLVLRALSDTPSTPDELDEIRQLLNRLENK